jgi:hypothetical protein
MSIEKSVLEKFLQLPLEKQKEVLEFVESIWQKFRGSKKEESEISKSEHERILRVLDGVSALSVETGPPVSNRDHDSHLYGGH